MAKRPTMAALLTLLALFIAGPCWAQTSNATADQTARNSAPWILMAADADGGWHAPTWQTLLPAILMIAPPAMSG